MGVIRVLRLMHQHHYLTVLLTRSLLLIAYSAILADQSLIWYQYCHGTSIDWNIFWRIFTDTNSCKYVKVD